jgi:hypothetical protein
MQNSVIASWIVTLVIQFLFPVALGLWFARRYGVGGGVFLYGALVFFVAQIVIRTPLLQALAPSIAPWVQSTPGHMTLYFAGLALTAGCSSRWGAGPATAGLPPGAHPLSLGDGGGLRHRPRGGGIDHPGGGQFGAEPGAGRHHQRMTPEALQAAVPQESLDAVLAARTQYLP